MLEKGTLTSPKRPDGRFFQRDGWEYPKQGKLYQCGFWSEAAQEVLVINPEWDTGTKYCYYVSLGEVARDNFGLPYRKQRAFEVTRGSWVMVTRVWAWEEMQEWAPQARITSLWVDLLVEDRVWKAVYFPKSCWQDYLKDK
jgi:hypothetical protein